MEHIQTSFVQISEFMEFCFSSRGYEIILVDDFSTDGTREWLTQLSKPNCRVHLSEKNEGRGGAVKTGMMLSKGDIVGFMDIDCEVSEAYLSKFAQAISAGGDLAIGMRIYRVSPQPYILLRHFLSVCYKALLRRKMGCKTLDSEVGYKFFSRRLTNYIVNQSRFNDWFWDTEVTLLSERNEFKIAEIPVAFKRNLQKTSSVHIFRDSVRYLQAFKKYNGLIRQSAYTLARELDAQHNKVEKIRA